jgi:Ni,Fe-hydrogenase I cytochrome b subunit
MLQNIAVQKLKYRCRDKHRSKLRRHSPIRVQVVVQYIHFSANMLIKCFTLFRVFFGYFDKTAEQEIFRVMGKSGVATRILYKI